jgi:hypothetical protein
MNPDFTKIPYGFNEFPQAKLAGSRARAKLPANCCCRSSRRRRRSGIGCAPADPGFGSLWRALAERLEGAERRGAARDQLAALHRRAMHLEHRFFAAAWDGTGRDRRQRDRRLRPGVRRHARGTRVAPADRGRAHGGARRAALRLGLALALRNDEAR